MKASIIFFLLFLYSCKDSKEIELVIEETITLPKEDYVQNGSLSMQFVEQNKVPYLYFSTSNIKTNDKELLVYNLNNKKLKKKYIFSREKGFNNSFSSFIYINKDSVLYTSSNDSLYVSNSNQEVLDKMKFEFEKNPLFPPMNWIYNPIVYCKQKLYYSPFYDEQKKVLNEKKFIFSFDLKTKKTDVLGTTFPKYFLESEYFSSNYYNTFNGNCFVYSPFNSHDIWIVDIKDGKFKKVDVKSEYFREFKKYEENTKPLTTKEYKFINCYYSRYSIIAYDKYRKVYYRFFYPGHDVDKSSSKLSELDRNPEKVSIIVLDDNFNKIGETLFENKNLSNLFFISPEGLFVKLTPKRILEDDKSIQFVKINITYEKN